MYVHMWQLWTYTYFLALVAFNSQKLMTINLCFAMMKCSLYIICQLPCT
jgi:hypothetical protein